MAKQAEAHAGLVVQLSEKEVKNAMKDIDEGGTDLLEKTMIVFGSPMADGNIHNHRRAPLIVLGHANGKLEGNLHLKAPDGTPMANAMLSMLHTLGHDDMDSFGDSTGELPLTMPTSASPDR